MKAMILAAGKGTRVQPITHVIPKPMMDHASYMVEGRLWIVDHGCWMMKYGCWMLDDG